MTVEQETLPEHHDERKEHTIGEQVQCHQGNLQGHRIYRLVMGHHQYQYLARDQGIIRDQHQRRLHGPTLVDMVAVEMAVAVVAEIQDIQDTTCHIRTTRLPNHTPRLTSRHILSSRRSSIIVGGMIPLSQ